MRWSKLRSLFLDQHLAAELRGRLDVHGKRRIEAFAAHAERILSSVGLVLLSARRVAMGKEPVAVICEHCGVVLAPGWRLAGG